MLSTEAIIWLVVGLVAVVVVAVAVILIVRHLRYLDEIKEHGWHYDSAPQFGNFLTYQAPPFGLGFDRKVDNLITGSTPDGYRFDCFEYRYDGRYRERVLSLELPSAIQTAFVHSAQPRAGIGMGPEGMFAADANGLTAVASSPELAEAVLAQVVGILDQPVDGEKLDLSIDGNRLVIAPADKDPDELSALILRVSGLVVGISGLAASFPAPPATPRFGFYGHPDWSFIGRDDTVMGRYPVAQGGFGHYTENLVRGARDGIIMDCFSHHWQTTEVRTVPDGRGGVTIQTYTENHQESVLGFALPFALPAISVNGRRLGERAQFESDDFNDSFKVRADNLKFASDVVHPRTMEWLLAKPPSAGWTISGPVVQFHGVSQDVFVMDACERTLRGFLGRIPRFVWDDLEIPVPPFLVE